MIRRVSDRSVGIFGGACHCHWPITTTTSRMCSVSAANSGASIISHPTAAKQKARTTTNVLSSLSNTECIDYTRGWAWQQALICHRMHTRRQMKLKLHQEPTSSSSSDDSDSDHNYHQQAQDDDCILLLEHAPVYTLGRGAREEHLTFLNPDDNGDNTSIVESNSAILREKLSRKNRGKDSARLSVDRRALEEEVLLRPMKDAVNILASNTASPVHAPNGVPIYRVDRGGEVTFHGPSQLVVYPVFDLKRDPHKPDLHWFLRMVEEVVIQTLLHYDIESVRDDINTGVWVGENKIAAVGVSASSWISSHGFALNVSPDLKYFDTSVILPCGIEGRGVTSIKAVLKERGETAHPSMEEVALVVLQSMEDVFQIEIEKPPVGII